MKTLGRSVSTLAYGSHVHKDVVSLLAELKWRAEADLSRLGIEGEQAANLIGRAEARVLATCHICESPIEQMMLAALGFMALDKLDCFPPTIHDVMSKEAWPTSPVVIIPQFVIARYRLDFLVVVESQPKPALIAVECDGKNFHTKDHHVTRDVTRDTYLEHLGIVTLRLTGREIFRRQWRIADELEHMVQWQREAQTT